MEIIPSHSSSVTQHTHCASEPHPPPLAKASADPSPEALAKGDLSPEALAKGDGLDDLVVIAGGAAPDPIPNSAVKTPSAHGTVPQGTGE